MELLIYRITVKKVTAGDVKLLLFASASGLCCVSLFTCIVNLPSEINKISR